MNVNYKNLGKVSVTANGVWNRDNVYERISIVTDSFTNKSYIAKQDVPAGIFINNREYWQEIAAGGYKDTNIIILHDTNPSTGEVVQWTLARAVGSVHVNDRHPGLVLGFYGKNTNEIDGSCTWYLYQFNSDSIADWDNLRSWVSVYDNVNKFTGYFLNKETLLKEYPNPTVGAYAFVGDNLETAVVYLCTKVGEWTTSDIPALQFANKYQSIYSQDFGEFDVDIDEKRADRATCDALGNIIHETYITRDDIANILEVAGYTNNRPRFKTDEHIGYRFFDRDLNKPIYWNGIAWVDSSGEIV